MTDANIKKTDGELQIVYAEVYVPNVPDSHGDFMTATEIRKMAHRFLASGRVNQIDSEHDNNLLQASVVESFIATKDDPTFIAGAWVAAVHIEDPDVWEKVKSGEINGFSFEGLVKQRTTTVTLEIPEYLVGKTMEDNGHVHYFKVYYDDEGKFLGGDTNEVDGHSHTITRGTITNEAEDGHAHKFSPVDLLAELNDEGLEE